MEQIPALSLPDVCTLSPKRGKAFCEEHCRVMEEHVPPVPTDLRKFINYCKEPTSRDSASYEWEVPSDEGEAPTDIDEGT